MPRPLGRGHSLRTLRGLNAATKDVSAKRNTILIFGSTGDLEIQTCRDAPDALRSLFELERDRPDRDIVLVRADTSDDVRLAFRNYFSDARDFIRMVERGCNKLTQRKPKQIEKSGARIRKTR
jgi:hypothetical protein